MVARAVLVVRQSAVLRPPHRLRRPPLRVRLSDPLVNARLRLDRQTHRLPSRYRQAPSLALAELLRKLPLPLLPKPRRSSRNLLTNLDSRNSERSSSPFSSPWRSWLASAHVCLQ